MAQTSQTAERFSAKDYRELSLWQKWKTRALFPKKSMLPFITPRASTTKVLLDGKKPIGVICFKDREILVLAARLNGEFYRQAGHTVGEELFRYYVSHRPFLSVYTERLTKQGENFAKRLERRGLGKIDRLSSNMTNIVVFQNARSKLRPHLNWG